MARLNEKTRDWKLYFCPTDSESCSVVTFIRGDTCPLCKTPGLIIRPPIDDRGMPSARPVA